MWRWLRKLLDRQQDPSPPQPDAPPNEAGLAAPQRVTASEPKGSDSLSERKYHLGLDWGTSSTKMVLRDYGSVGGPHAMVLTADGRGERYPSTVILEGGRLWFGWEAEARRARATLVWDSLKAKSAVRGGWHNSAGLDGVVLADLVALSLAHAICIGQRQAAEHAASMRATARMTMTLGAPEPDLQVRSDAYLDAVAPAYLMVRDSSYDPQGRPADEGVTQLRTIKDDVLPHIDRSSDNRDRWLRPEVAAAMMWLYESPRVGEGPYTVIDIGAATTNASFFRIHSVRDPDGIERRKGALAFLGAATRPPGMDALGEALIAASGTRESIASIRGRERALIENHMADSAVNATLEGMYDTWALARKHAWPRAPELKHWEGLRYLIVGGGSKLPQIVRRFDELPGYLRGKLQRYGPLDHPGRPNDLHRFAPGANVKAYGDDPTFLLVAYGLSFRSGDLPDFALPNEVSPFKKNDARRPFRDSDDLGYEK